MRRVEASGGGRVGGWRRHRGTAAVEARHDAQVLSIQACAPARNLRVCSGAGLASGAAAGIGLAQRRAGHALMLFGAPGSNRALLGAAASSGCADGVRAPSGRGHAVPGPAASADISMHALHLLPMQQDCTDRCGHAASCCECCWPFGLSLPLGCNPDIADCNCCHLDHLQCLLGPPGGSRRPSPLPTPISPLRALRAPCGRPLQLPRAWRSLPKPREGGCWPF